MFDIFGKMSALASPELIAMVETLPAKVAEWTEFLKRLTESQKRNDAALERVENNMAFVVTQNQDISEKLVLLMSTTALTPELQFEVETMAATDPRNGRLFVHGIGEPIQ
jgi:hypothetical protein